MLPRRASQHSYSQSRPCPVLRRCSLVACLHTPTLSHVHALLIGVAPTSRVSTLLRSVTSMPCSEALLPCRVSPHSYSQSRPCPVLRRCSHVVRLNTPTLSHVHALFRRRLRLCSLVARLHTPTPSHVHARFRGVNAPTSCVSTLLRPVTSCPLQKKAEALLPCRASPHSYAQSRPKSIPYRGPPARSPQEETADR